MSAPPMKFTVIEACDRIKEEFAMLQAHYHGQKMDMEKMQQERAELNRHCLNYYEMSYNLNFELHRQQEIVKRLTGILTNVIPFLSQEQQQHAMTAIERAKNISNTELEAIINGQKSDSNFFKFSNGALAFSPEQLELYKQMQNLAGLSGAGGAGPNGPLFPPPFGPPLPGPLSNLGNLNNLGSGQHSLSAPGATGSAQGGSHSMGPPMSGPMGPVPSAPSGPGPSGAGGPSLNSVNNMSLAQAQAGAMGNPAAAALSALSNSAINPSLVNALANNLGNPANLAAALQALGPAAASFLAMMPNHLGQALAGAGQAAAGAQGANLQAQHAQQMNAAQQLAAAASAFKHEQAQKGLIQPAEERPDARLGSHSRSPPSISNSASAAPLGMLSDGQDSHNASASASLAQAESKRRRVTSPHRPASSSKSHNEDDGSKSDQELVVDDADYNGSPSGLLNGGDKSRGESHSKDVVSPAHTNGDAPHSNASVPDDQSNRSTPSSLTQARGRRGGEKGSKLSHSHSQSQRSPTPLLQDANRVGHSSSLVQVGKMPAPSQGAPPGAGSSGGLQLPGGISIPPGLLPPSLMPPSGNAALPPSTPSAGLPMSTLPNFPPGSAPPCMASQGPGPSLFHLGLSLPNDVNPYAAMLNSLQASLPPGALSNPANASAMLATIQRAGLPVPPMMIEQLQALAAQGFPNAVPPLKLPYAFHVSPEGHTQPVPLPADHSELLLPGLPRRATPIASLPQGDVVCAVTISNPTKFVFTGGRGSVKIWDIYNSKSQTPISALDCFDRVYIRSIKLLNDTRTMIVGGEANSLTIFDIATSCKKSELPLGTNACYAIALTPDNRQCFACCSDGNVSVFDLHNAALIRQFHAHNEGVSCVDMCADGNRLWTGGLDAFVRSWDLRELRLDGPAAASTPNAGSSPETRPLQYFEVDAQIFSLGSCPAQLPSLNGNVGEWLAVGMENGKMDMLQVAGCVSGRTEKYRVEGHDSSVLSLKFANTGRWFITTGKDNLVYTWRAPFGANLIQMKEQSSVLCSDISPDDKYIVTGNGDKRATLYELLFA